MLEDGLTRGCSLLKMPFSKLDRWQAASIQQICEGYVDIEVDALLSNLLLNRGLPCYVPRSTSQRRYNNNYGGWQRERYQR